MLFAIAVFGSLSQTGRQAPTDDSSTVSQQDTHPVTPTTTGATEEELAEAVGTPKDDARRDTADNGDDQPIAPGLGNQNVAIEEAKLDAINSTKYNVTKCIDGYLKILPGNTTRKQAEQKVSQVCSGSFIEFISLSRHYGHPEIAQLYQDQYKSWIDREMSEIYGPPQSN